MQGELASDEAGRACRLRAIQPLQWWPAPTSLTRNHRRPSRACRRLCLKIRSPPSAIARQGISIIELDLRITKDGQIVVLHDLTVDRTTDCCGAAADIDLARINLRWARAMRAYLGDVSRCARQAGECSPTSRMERRSGRCFRPLKNKMPSTWHPRAQERQACRPRASSAAGYDHHRLYAGDRRRTGFANAGADIIRLWSDWVEADPALVARNANSVPSMGHGRPPFAVEASRLARAPRPDDRRRCARLDHRPARPHFVAMTAGYSGTPLAQEAGPQARHARLVPEHARQRPRRDRARRAADRAARYSRTAGRPRPYFRHQLRRARLRTAHAPAADRARRNDLGQLAEEGVARSPTDITEDVIRDVALPLGLVDVKVCAVDETWSGLKLVIRKELPLNYSCERFALSTIYAPMIVCVCNAIREDEVRAAARDGAPLPDAAYAALGREPRCGCCLDSRRRSSTRSGSGPAHRSSVALNSPTATA